MQKGFLHQRGVVSRDVVHRRIILLPVVRAANADNRHGDIRQQGFDGAIVVIGDHPIAQPLPDVVDAAAEIFFDEDIPVSLRRLQILTDALHNLTVIHFVGVKQQGNAIAFLMHDGAFP